MKIEAIQLNNVEELYEAIYAAQTSEKMKKEVGPHLNHLYQRISVVFQLSEVTPIDAMMLHKLTNGMTVDISGYQQAPIEVTTPLSTAVSGLNRLMDRIVSDIDVSAVMEIDTPSFMPLSYFRKTVLVTLTDTAIGMVFGADPTFVFYNAYKEDGFPYPFKESDKLLDILCKIFFENYYKALLAEINTNDMIADGMSYNSYYRPTMESDYLLSHAITPFGTIGIMRCENDTIITKENSERLIQMARAANKVASDDWIFLQTKLIYVMRIPIFIYCMLEEKLPPGSIIDHEYFRIVATDEIILDEDDIFAQREAFSTLFELAEKDDLDILGFSSMFTQTQYGLGSYIHHYYETPIIYQPNITKLSHDYSPDGKVKRTGDNIIKVSLILIEIIKLLWLKILYKKNIYL